MTQAITHRQFEPGTTGWMVDDLQDPDIQWLWSEGRYELVDGVLTKTAPQGFEGIGPLSCLRRLIEKHLDSTKQGGTFHNEVDLLLRPSRVARPDMIFLTSHQHRQQKLLQLERGHGTFRYHPVYITPPLVVESLSVGHEYHDRVTKREWYAEANIPNYWLLDARERSLVCLALEGDSYIEEGSGRDNDIVRASIFGGVTIPLADVWGDV
jgi:Uma2 family endonuclease